MLSRTIKCWLDLTPEPSHVDLTPQMVVEEGDVEGFAIGRCCKFLQEMAADNEAIYMTNVLLKWTMLRSKLPGRFYIPDFTKWHN